MIIFLPAILFEFYSTTNSCAFTFLKELQM